MTANPVRLTDELLRRSLAELAAGPDASQLLTEVLRTVDATAQVRRRPWDTRGWGRYGVLLAAALLVAAAIGTAVALSRPQPAPLPTPTVPVVPVADAIQASDFVVPFSYRLPASETVRLSGPVGRSLPYTIYARESREPTRRLEVFLVSGWVHSCAPATTTRPIAREPQALLEALRDQEGVGVGPISATTLGNLPAMAAEIDPAQSACAAVSFHEDGLGIGGQAIEPSLSNPGRVIVGQTRDTTIGVIISAATAEAYADWLPIALGYVNSFVFEDLSTTASDLVRVTDFPQWFAYRLPTADAAKLTHGPSGYSLRDGSRELRLIDIWTQTVSDPPSVVQDLLGTWGACLEHTGSSTLGNLPAVSARFTPGSGTCSELRFHEPGIGSTDVVVSDPATLLVAQTSHGTIGVIISAASADELAAWTPTAMAYVDSFEFTTLNSFDNAP